MKHAPHHYDWGAALYIVACGIVLLLPGETFAYSPAYESLTQYGTETSWGLFCSAVGLARIGALLWNGRAPRGSPLIRCVAAMLGAGTWVTVGYGFIAFSMQSGVWSLGCSYFVLGMLDLGATARAAIDAAKGHQFLIARRVAHGHRQH